MSPSFGVAGEPAPLAAADWRRAQLDLEVELVAVLHDALHSEAIQADEAANVISHPLLLLTP
jgi:2-keto-4-pentenoate hydratase